MQSVPMTPISMVVLTVSVNTRSSNRKWLPFKNGKPLFFKPLNSRYQLETPPQMLICRDRAKCSSCPHFRKRASIRFSFVSINSFHTVKSAQEDGICLIGKKQWAILFVDHQPLPFHSKLILNSLGGHAEQYHCMLIASFSFQQAWRQLRWAGNLFVEWTDL